MSEAGPGALRKVLKRVRSSQPFNAVATTGIRWILRVTGVRSGLPVRHLHRVGEVKATLPNGKVLKLWSQGDDWITNRVFWGGWDGYDPEVAGLFFRMAEKADTVLDIGSYVGFYSIVAAHANSSATVIAFEPMVPIYDRLQRHAALNSLSNLQCVNAAVGEREGLAEFYHVTSDLPSSSSLSQEFMQDTDGVVHSTVEVVAIDPFLDRMGVQKVDLVKLDTESTEPQALRGMLKTLERDHPDLVCEVLVVGDTGAEIEEILAPLGYDFYLMTDEGLEPKAHVEGDPKWFNYLFTIRPTSFWIQNGFNIVAASAAPGGGLH